MAKTGYMWRGAKGKFGDIVFAKGENATIARPLVTPRNPKTTAQAKQRMAFAMATSAAKALKFIVNHSFENISGEKANVREFVRLNAKMLRAAIDTFLAGGENKVGSAQIKGARGMQPAPYIISRGTVEFPASIDYGGYTGYEISGEALMQQNFNTQAAYVEHLAKIGFAPGDQISLIEIHELPTEIAKYESESNFLNKVYAARATFKPVLPANFNGSITVSTPDNLNILNPALLDDQEGTIALEYEGAGTSEEPTYNVYGFVVEGDNKGTLMAGAFVRSQKDMNGDYAYSNAQFVYFGEGADPEIVMGSYLNSASNSDSEYFLDQAENSKN